jgi:ribosome-binding ATPase
MRGWKCLRIVVVCVVGSEEAVKKAGKLKMQGKKYEVQDGDCIFFKFNT